MFPMHGVILQGIRSGIEQIWFLFPYRSKIFDYPYYPYFPFNWPLDSEPDKIGGDLIFGRFSEGHEII